MQMRKQITTLEMIIDFELLFISAKNPSTVGTTTQHVQCKMIVDNDVSVDIAKLTHFSLT